jgi:hypothetical protein
MANTTHIKNISKEAISFVVGRDDNGEPKVETLKPSEARSLRIPEDRPDVVGRVAAGVIVVGENSKAAKAAAPVS